MTSNDKGKVPHHHGRFPFPPEEKIPAVIRPDMKAPRVYGHGDTLITTCTHVSTDRIHVCTFTVLPGKYFDPPDVHVGDEVYYLLKGNVHMLNPESGEVLAIEEGDFFYIPAGTWHQVYNYGKIEAVFINWIAPQLWSNTGKGTSINFDKDPVVYKKNPQEDYHGE